MKFSTPIVCRAKGGWFVFFRYWHEGRPYPIKISRAKGTDLNRMHDLKEREQHFKALCAARHDWLKMGWNPKTDPEFKNRDVNLNVQSWNVEQAFTHAIKNKKLAKKSFYDYKKSVQYFIKASREYGIDGLPIQDLKRSHIKTVFAHLINVEKLSAKNYNKRLTHIKSLLSELVEWEAIEANPAFRLKDLATEETHKYIPITDNEKAKIRAYLFLKDYNFFVFVLSVYFTGLRPCEILSLRVKDIDLVNNLFHLQPFANQLKTKKQRVAIIHKRLRPFYDQMQLPEREHFVFSQDFKPGPVKLETKHATRLWKKYVITELGINKHLYALRHTSADDLIDSGVPADDISKHFGHRSKLMIQRYTQKGISKSLQVVCSSDIDF